MNLVIDQGNTVTKVAVFKTNVLIETFLYEVFDKSICSLLVANYSIDSCIYCTVVEPSKEVLSYLDNKISNFLFIDESTALPVKNNYKTPKTLGKDRLGAVVEANALYPKRNVLVIDVGTAITYEFIDKEAVYWGGNISLGITMRFKALNAYTEKLPILDRFGDLPDIGCDTETAIRAGVVRGVIFEIRGYIDEFKACYPELQVVLTGGHTKYIESQLDREIAVDVNLVLKGLNRILNYNVVKE